MTRVAVVFAAVLTALVVVPAALADNDTTKAGYGGEAAVQVTLVQSGGGTVSDVSTGSGEAEGVAHGQVATQAVASQSLPVTGAEIGVLLAAGSILVIVGLGMRRLARQRD